jgi:acetate kinase
MAAARSRLVLTMNTGSATLKAAIYELDPAPKQVLFIQVNNTREQSRIRISDSSESTLLDESSPVRDRLASFGTIIQWLADHDFLSQLVAAGHRLVHGGPLYAKPERITPAFLAEIEQLVPLDPDHLPDALSAIQVIQQKLPELPQVACFDTAFHASMPKVARMYALPRRLYDGGLRRFGFHGLSYEYILQELCKLEGSAAEGRVIVAHLGSGASMVAISAGSSMDTSMGFTPLEGLVMGTRCGDIDGGAVLYLLEQGKMSAEELDTQLNKQSGLLGVSGSSADMRDLLQLAAKGDIHADEALELFCYRSKKYIGAYAAALGGIDILVFTGGIGEKAATVRDRICRGLEFLGIQIDPERNQENADIISTSASRVKVRVIETNEDLMILQHVISLLGWTNREAS